MKLLVLNGPNINMLGIREPDIYGRETYDALLSMIEAHCAARGIEVECYQSNHEGDLVDKIQAAYGDCDGIVINPAAYTHERGAAGRREGGQHPHCGGAYFRRGRARRIPTRVVYPRRVRRDDQRARVAGLFGRDRSAGGTSEIRSARTETSNKREPCGARERQDS